MVFKAVYRGQACVLKEFRIGSDPAEQRRIIKESRLLHRLAHPNIATVTSVFFENSRGYLLMPFYAGGNLVEWCQSIKPGDVQLLSVLAQALRGIEHIHRHGVVHCDIKPQNIMIDSEDNTVKVIDFDVSKNSRERAQATALIARTTMAGTLDYMAPELRVDGGSASFATDMYAFGAVVYDLHFVEVARARGEQPQPRPTIMQQMLKPDVPIPKHSNEQLCSFIDNLLNSKPAARLPAAAALSHALFTSSLVVDQQKEVTARAEAASARARLETELAGQADALKQEHAQVLRLKEQQLQARIAVEARQRQLALEADELKKAQEKSKALTDAERLKLKKKSEEVEAKRAQAVAELDRVRTADQKAKRDALELEAKLRDVHRREREAHKHIELPSYWKTSTLSSGTVQRIDVTKQLRDAVQRMFNKSCFPDFIGTGRDAHGLRHKGFQVLSVERVENVALWKAYTAARSAVAKAGPHAALAPRPASECKWQHAALHLVAESNEVLLFHGTKDDCVDKIAHNGFDERYSSGGLFGAFTYFAENSCKSDQYIPPTANGEIVFFLARVSLGSVRPLYSQQDLQQPRDTYRPQLRPDKAGAFYDSMRYICPRVQPHYPAGYRANGARPQDGQGGQPLRYNEFMVHRGQNAFPELIVRVKRVNVPNPK